MKSIKWDTTGFIINGERKALISGEFHYFRVPQKDWKYRLRLLKDSGANCVSTIAPWEIHEPTEGNFIFNDCPARNISAFLQACSEEGLFVIVRPGPYQYGELVNDGLPDWLLAKYPEVLLTDIFGNQINDAVSYLHPTFLKKARLYYKAINQIIKSYLVDNGGTVCLVQPDNELAGVHLWRGTMDYNSETMGFGKSEGRYPMWLKTKYGCIDLLNQAYGTSYKDFSQVNPIDLKGISNQAGNFSFSARCSEDYYKFYCHTLAEYLLILKKWFREDGITVPLCHNAAGVGMLPHFLECVKTMGNDFLLGVDNYYTLGPAWANNNPSPQSALNVLMGMDYIRAMGLPQTVFELQCGNLSDFPPVFPGDLKAWYMTNTAFGMKGFNYYIFSGGPNFEETGSTCLIYDYNAAVSSENEIRPTYYSLKSHNEFISTHSWLQDTQRKSTISLGFSWEGQSCEYYDKPGQLLSGMEAYNYQKNGLLFSLMGSSYQPELIEIGNELTVDKPLILPCSDTLSAEKQRKIILFVEEGGSLAITPVVPTMDEEYNPCTLLKDFLEIGNISKLQGYDGRIRLQDGQIIHQVHSQFTCDGLGKGSEAIAFNYATGTPIAYKKSFGSGKIIWLGAKWNYLLLDHIQIVSWLSRQLGAKEMVRCSNHTIWTALWETEEHAVLFVMNLFSGQQKSRISVNIRGNWVDLGEIIVNAMDVITIEL